MNCSTSGLPVHHQLLEFTQTHVHWVSVSIQPSHPLLSPSPAFNLSQHQGIFKWVKICIRWPKYWSFSFNISSFQWTFRTDLGRTNILSALSSYLWMWNISFISSYLVSFEFCTFPRIDLLYILLDLYLSISFLSANVSSIVFFFNFKFHLFINNIWERNWLLYINFVSFSLTTVTYWVSFCWLFWIFFVDDYVIFEDSFIFSSFMCMPFISFLALFH